MKAGKLAIWQWLSRQATQNTLMDKRLKQSSESTGKAMYHLHRNHPDFLVNDPQKI